jgi:hypothetical protein
MRKAKEWSAPRRGFDIAGRNKLAKRDEYMRRWILILTAVVAVSAPCAGARPRPTPTPTGKTARLIVQRAPNFGSDLFIRLSIDGKRVGDIPRNQHYGGFVSAGRHTVAALALPNTQARRPTSMQMIAKAGQVYIFTATWNGDRLVLVPSTYYMPTTRANKG